MESYGVILKKLREINKLTLKKAAAHIGRSAGWLSEVENNKGNARIHPAEYERIISIYNGESYRRQFGAWIAKGQQKENASKEVSFHGAILRFLRKKTKMTLEEASAKLELSPCYLSLLELGRKPLSILMRDKILNLYGYSPSSFKNFTTEDKRAKNIPSRYKLNILLKQLDDAKIDLIFNLAIESLNKSESKKKEM